MVTKCYAQVRGSAIRATSLGARGQIPSPVRYATSKSVASVTINEMSESALNELLKNEDEETRVRLTRPAEQIRFTVDINFLRVDPGLLELIAGVPVVHRDGEETDVIGFDQISRLKPIAFGLEIWSMLAGSHCADDGQRQYGYTLFPYLKGGRLGGFTFDNGLVSFNLIGAQTRRMSRWGVGPYDMTGWHERLQEKVSGNLSFTNFITTLPPPDQEDGVQEFTDIIDNGVAADPHGTDIIDGGTASVTTPWIIEGGRAL